MNTHLAQPVLAAAAAARAFGPDVCRFVRRGLAAGVRLGASELTRSRNGQREDDR